MLQPELLLFSRTISCDYRWIYNSKSLSQDDLEKLNNDYRSFDHKKAEYLKRKHLFVRKLANSIVLYSFSQSRNTDENSRPIFALTGLVFTGFDCSILSPILHVVAASLFINPNRLFDCDFWGATDNISNQSLRTEISLDEIVQQCKKDKEIYSLMEIFNKTTVNVQFALLCIMGGKVNILQMQPFVQNQANLGIKHTDNIYNRALPSNDISLSNFAQQKQGFFNRFGSHCSKKKSYSQDND